MEEDEEERHCCGHDWDMSFNGTQGHSITAIRIKKQVLLRYAWLCLYITNNCICPYLKMWSWGYKMAYIDEIRRFSRGAKNSLVWFKAYLLGWGFFPKFFFGIPEIFGIREFPKFRDWDFRDFGIPEIRDWEFSGFRDSRTSGLIFREFPGFSGKGLSIHFPI